ncbi:MAG: NAD-dependent epimerase/dehydratase family protein, partial [Microthrixaceae bacterium]|nr:NAD-dependent epimerase/dehydratase family protein [Microthrixaceae bacterium]
MSARTRGQPPTPALLCCRRAPTSARPISVRPDAAAPVRALVTGAGGFVGGHLTSHLQSSGDEVIAWDRTLEGLDITDGPAVAAA